MAMLRPWLMPLNPPLLPIAAVLAALLPASLLSAQGFGPIAEQAHRFEGGVLDGQLGWAAASAGDVDGDGTPDLLYGGHLQSPGGLLRAGSAFVSSGQDGSLLLQFDGAAAGDYLGQALAGVGDVDGDGTPDLLIASPYADPAGRVDAGAVDLRSGADGSLLLRLEGLAGGDLYGYCVAGAGDVDQDGTPDLLIGARAADPNGLASAGSAFVHSGADGALLYRFDGSTAGEWFGRCVAGVGDLNGDGAADLMVGAPLASPASGTSAGSVFVYSGADGSELLRFDGAFGADHLGMAVAAAGDIDGDGTPDLMAGAPGADPAGLIEAGSALVWSGATGALLFQVDGPAAGDELGRAVAGLGDCDGDAIPDFLVGSGRFDFLSNPNAGGVFALSGADASVLHFFHGSAGDRMGDAVASAGDLNGDGLSDILFGAWGAPGAAGGGAGAVEAWLSLADTDGDLLADLHEAAAGTDDHDQDSDDDGLSDWRESSLNAAWTGTDPLLLDSDADLLQDGTELGVRNGLPGDPGLGILGTDPAIFQPDMHPASTTDPLDPDSDGGGIGDGAEDANLNGRQNLGETDATDPLDDRVPGTLTLSSGTISAAAGDTIIMTINFHDGMAGHHFRMLGSMTGTDPGILYGGVSIPLTYDLLTEKLARMDYEPSMQNFSGYLDGNGDAASLIITVPNELAAWVGLSFWWSVLSMEGTVPSNATNAAVLTVTP